MIIHSSVDASTVILEAIETKLEGREIRDLGGNVSPIEETDVAKCSIFKVYPEPTFVTFTVGDQRIEVPAVAEPVEYEGVFDISAILTLFPSAEYDQKNVSCFSQAASTAQKIGPNNGASFALDVTCTNFKLKMTFKALKLKSEIYVQFQIIQPKSILESAVRIQSNTFGRRARTLGIT